MSEQASTPETAIKVTLSTHKIVVLREPTIRHTELAAQAAAPRAGGDPHLLGMMANKEMLKFLIIEIDGKRPSRSELENLDKLFTLKEYSQLQKVVQKLGGVEGNEEPVIEIGNSGDK